MALLRNIVIQITAVFILGMTIALRFLAPEAQKPAIPASPPSATTTNAVEPLTTSPMTTVATVTPPVTAKPRIAEKKAPAPKIITPPPSLLPPPTKPIEKIATTTAPEVATTTPSTPELKIPPIDEEELMKAVVRIRCGVIYGSGFVINPKGLVLTAAHVVMKTIEDGAAHCEVIFPRKHPDFGYYSEAHYRVGAILTPKETEKFYKERGFDIAALSTAFLGNDPVFPEEFPYIKYPFCGPKTLNDKILLFGYAANIGTSAASLGSVLSRFEGGVLQYGDVISVRKAPSQIYRGAYDYFPDLSYTLDESVQHSSVVIYSSNNFSGASGGLVFDTSQNCIIGINNAVATAGGDPRIFGFVTNPNFPEMKSWLDNLIAD